jgi:hypothetical protein
MSHALSFVRCGAGLEFTISYRTAMQGRQTDLSHYSTCTNLSCMAGTLLATATPSAQATPLSHAWPYGRTISRAVSTPVHAGGPAQEADSGHARVSSFLGFIESSGSDDLCAVACACADVDHVCPLHSLRQQRCKNDLHARVRACVCERGVWLIKEEEGLWQGTGRA